MGAAAPAALPPPVHGQVRGVAASRAARLVRIGLLAASLGGLAADAAAVKPRAVKPAAALAGDAMAGQLKADSERCLECHVQPGIGQGNSGGEDGKFARLAGQQHAYIVKQVEDFRAGRRRNDFMTMMAGSISDQDVADIAAYFAAQPAMPAALRFKAAAASVAGAAGTGERTAGSTVATAASSQDGRHGAAAQLFHQGDPGRNVTACAACHGAAGEGAAGIAPVIGGQGRRYLSQQLHNWRSGARANNPVMTAAAAALTDQEIEALALYVSEM